MHRVTRAIISTDVEQHLSVAEEEASVNSAHVDDYMQAKKIPTPTAHPFPPSHLNHLVNQLGHVLLPVTGITTLDETDKLPWAPSAGRVRQLEWPKVGGGLLEVGSAGSDFVHKVLHALLC